MRTVRTVVPPKLLKRVEIAWEKIIGAGHRVAAEKWATVSSPTAIVADCSARIKSGRFVQIRAHFFRNYTCPWLYLSRQRNAHFAHQQLHIVPDLSLGGGVAQQVRRMVGAKHAAAAVLEEFATQAADRHVGVQQ